MLFIGLRVHVKPRLISLLDTYLVITIRSLYPSTLTL
jgi:hypothetical protein